jgi:hypothetical protein
MIMRRLLTGYAVSYNLKYRRHGHLFQNRYKSILCQEDPYLLELVRYIHLNPLRAGLVSTMQDLDRYRFCGHSILVGRRKNDWQDVDAVLRLFGTRIAAARKEYREFVVKGIPLGKRPELVGGGLIRSAGGWQELRHLKDLGIHLKSDERMLGDGDFVESVLERQNEQFERRYRLRAQGYDFRKVVERVGQYRRSQRKGDPCSKQEAGQGSGKKSCLLLVGEGNRYAGNRSGSASRHDPVGCEQSG